MNLLGCLRGPWRDVLAEEFDKPYMRGLQDFLQGRIDQGYTVYPPLEHVFEALNLTSPAAVKVVLLGQDPYHGPGQAHGLAFSVRPGQPPPPSLVNIFRELEQDTGIAPPADGFLEPWARRGVLLLNPVLTVERGRAGAHRGRGWERFTDTVIERVNALSPPSVFLLWGAQAQKKAGLVDADRHAVLRAPHPSPLSAYRGFFGSRHFSRANDFLRRRGRGPVDWRLPG